MPRRPRIRSKTGFYHITNRGVNRADVFLDDDDFRAFLDALNRAHEVCEFNLIAYCLMTNHFHLIVQVDEGHPIPPSLFQSLGARFCLYYHRRHRTAGAVFQGRFRSEAIESETHLLSAIRYVWNNPVAAGMCRSAGDYRWSSYGLLGREGTMVDGDFLLGLMDVDQWAAFTSEGDKRKHLEPFPKRLPDDMAKKLVNRLCSGFELGELRAIGASAAVDFIEKCKEFGVSLAQVARAADMPASALYSYVRKWRQIYVLEAP